MITNMMKINSIINETLFDTELWLPLHTVNHFFSKTALLLTKMQLYVLAEFFFVLYVFFIGLLIIVLSLLLLEIVSLGPLLTGGQSSKRKYWDPITDKYIGGGDSEGSNDDDDNNNKKSKKKKASSESDNNKSDKEKLNSESDNDTTPTNDAVKSQWEQAKNDAKNIDGNTISADSAVHFHSFSRKFKTAKSAQEIINAPYLTDKEKLYKLCKLYRTDKFSKEPFSKLNDDQASFIYNKLKKSVNAMENLPDKIEFPKVTGLTFKQKHPEAWSVKKGIEDALPGIYQNLDILWNLFNKKK